jgi:PAS domain S-box-containing protein
MDIECAGVVDLKDVDSKYRLLFECARDIVFLIDINGKIVDANYAAVKEYGYSREKLLSLNVKDLRTRGERSYAEIQLREAFEKGAIYETIHMRKDGSEFPVEISSSGFIIEDRKMLLSIVRDITKRKQAERVLYRLAAIVESSDDAILGMTTEGIITDWNQGAMRMYEYTAEEMIGRSVEILIPPENLGELARIIRSITQEGRMEHYDTVRIRKNGDRVFVSLSATPIKTPKGEIQGISWISRDITQRKQAEEKIAYVASFPELNPNPIIEINDKGTITYSNSAAKRLFPGMDSWDINHPMFEGLLAGNGVLKEAGEKQVVREVQLGGVYYLQTIHYMPKNRTIRIYSIDITERKQTEAALAAAKKQAELYLDLMGHDINNMNQIAMGFLEVALESFELNEEEREILEKPLDTLKNSSKLIDNVRKLQKLEEGGLRYREVDLCDILSGVIANYSNIPGRNVIINYEPLPGCHIVANELIGDVFSNLINNSIKHSDPLHTLTIDIGLEETIQKGKEYYRITVEDDGPGIPNGLKNRLFMRCQRGQTKTSGKGLGLYLVRTLVNDFHGKIWVEDRVPGDHTKGARFVVMLPAAEK